MRSGGGILLALASALMFGAPAAAATIKTVPGKAGHVMIHLAGRIEPGDSDAFLAALRKASAADKRIDGVQLNSLGGRLVEGALLAATIKAAHLPTIVVDGARCASACFLAFAAGESKSAAAGAFIGVHKAAERGGRETLRSGAATVAMARFARDLGVPSAIVRRMTATPPERVEWLTAHDLRSMGVAIDGKAPEAVQTAASAGSPQHLPAAAILPIQPQAAEAKAAISPQSWNEFIDRTMVLSAEQNQGSAAISRLCEPETRECVMAVAYLLKDGRQALAMIAQDNNGNVIRREVCESNAANDMRQCTDWDTGAKYQDIRTTQGKWKQVAD